MERKRLFRVITKEKLLEPPHDVDRLDRLEGDIAERARKFIKNIVDSRKFNINDVQLAFEYRNVSAEARILSDGNYRIRIGRPFSSAMLKFSVWSAPLLWEHLNITSRLAELEEFLYEWWMWLTLHHELSHVLCGHMDFLLSHGMVRYAEINGGDENNDSLNVDGVGKRDAWWVIESEADSQASAFALASVPLMKHRDLLKDQTTFETIAMHGTLVGLYFVLFDKLSSANDLRHPAPSFRKVICQSSLEKLCKKMQINNNLAIEAMISADFGLYRDILNIPIDLDPASEAFNWMLKMDDLLRAMNMKQFRKL